MSRRNRDYPLRERRSTDQPNVTSASTQCPDQNEEQSIHLTRGTDGGSFDWSKTINGVTEDITINYDDEASDVETAFEGHSEIVSGDVVCSGGPLPYVSITIVFQGNLAGKVVPVGTIDITNLIGDSALAIPIREQKGFPGDAS